VKIILADREQTRLLLAHHFDHIFFTGGQLAAREIMSAAALHTTPVTLELGGKCPCIVFDDADLDIAARRIAWGKFINCGQTCVAPDYVMVHRSIEAAFLSRLSEALTQFFGDDPRRSNDYGRIVSVSHFDRLTGYLGEGRVAVGGATDRDALYIAPTLLVDVADSARIMQEEIFGPILPIVAFDEAARALSIIKSKGKPLSVYVFTEDAKRRECVLEGTSSGSVCVNDVVLQSASPSLPFGGVGESGFGRYQGRAGFDNFSNYRSILHRRLWPEPSLRFPPWRKAGVRWIDWLMSWR